MIPHTTSCEEMASVILRVYHSQCFDFKCLPILAMFVCFHNHVTTVASHKIMLREGINPRYMICAISAFIPRHLKIIFHLGTKTPKR